MGIIEAKIKLPHIETASKGEKDLPPKNKSFLGVGFLASRSYPACLVGYDLRDVPEIISFSLLRDSCPSQGGSFPGSALVWHCAQERYESVKTGMEFRHVEVCKELMNLCTPHFFIW